MSSGSARSRLSDVQNCCGVPSNMPPAAQGEDRVAAEQRLLVAEGIGDVTATCDPG